MFVEDKVNGYIKTPDKAFYQGDLLEPAYAAYSLASGNLDGEPGEDLVVGIPRGLVKNRFTNKNNKTVEVEVLAGKVEFADKVLIMIWFQKTNFCRINITAKLSINNHINY